MKDQWPRRTAAFAKKPYTPNWPGKAVKPTGKFYKNLTNVKGKVSPMRPKVTKAMQKKMGFSK